MAKKKQRKSIQLPLSPEKYIRTRSRNLPIGECLVNSDWKDGGLAHILIVREHSTKNITVGIYLVDIFCLGLKDTTFKFNLSAVEYREFVEQISEEIDLIPIDYVLAHNIIYGAIAYAEDLGFNPHKDFNRTTKFILDEDDENVELIELDFGKNGKPYLIINVLNEPYAGYIKTLEDTVGIGNFDYVLPTNDDTLDYADDDFDENIFMIRLYDEDMEKRIEEELEKLDNMSEEEFKNSYKNDNLLLETYYRTAELSFTRFFTDKEKFEVLEFTEKLFDLNYPDQDNFVNNNIENFDKHEIEDYLNMLQLLYDDKPKSAIRKLKPLIAQHPDNPTLLGCMISALLDDNKQRKADALTIYAWEKHAENLRIRSMYLGYLFRNNRYKEFEKISGNYYLQDIYPDVELFDFNETLQYFKIIYMLFLNTGQLLKARSIFYYFDMLEIEDLDYFHEAYINEIVEFLSDKKG